MTTLAPKRELQRRIGNHNGDRRNPTPNSSMISRARAGIMVELIQDAAIPLCIVGLLYALPGTQLTQRLEKEGRLHPNHDVFSPGDQVPTA